MTTPDDEMSDDNLAKEPSTKHLLNTDLPDNEHDEARMQPEEVILDLPDVSEIPGQEHIVVPRILEMQDVTIASDDEEGVGLFGDDEEDEDTRIIMGTEADITEVDNNLLSSKSENEDGDESRLSRSQLDHTDEQGDALNEGSSGLMESGSDLDISGSDGDDPMENIGEEDEENNYYSLGGDEKDNLEDDRS